MSELRLYLIYFILFSLSFVELLLYLNFDFLSHNDDLVFHKSDFCSQLGLKILIFIT